MAQLLTPDICVIGAGSGGLSVAAAAAAFGVPVVLIENRKMGGDCLNYGCVPSKALIAAANRAHASATAGTFGVDARPAIAFARTHRHVHQVIAAIAPNDSKERFTGLGVRVVWQIDLPDICGTHLHPADVPGGTATVCSTTWVAPAPSASFRSSSIWRLGT